MNTSVLERENQLILVVDDSEMIHVLIGASLLSEGVEVLHAYDARSAKVLTREQKPDLLLLDLQLPDQNGLAFLQELKDDVELNAIPVIFLTGTNDVPVKVQAFNAGAIDYITKPFDNTELRARVNSALRTKRYQDLLATRAQLDGLTGLWNRTHFDQRLADEVAVSQRHKRPVSLIMLDIDHFKRINDAYGHPFGDLVLRRIANLLAGCLRQTEIACRYGGEEFGIILRETDHTGAMIAAERIRSTIEALELRFNTLTVRVTASLGVSSNEHLEADFSPNQLLLAADECLYLAKQQGRNRVIGSL